MRMNHHRGAHSPALELRVLLCGHTGKEVRVRTTRKPLVLLVVHVVLCLQEARGAFEIDQDMKVGKPDRDYTTGFVRGVAVTSCGTDKLRALPER